jgi:putative flippase GtrA
MGDARQTVRQAGRYLLVGFCSAGIELLLFVVLDSLLGVDVRLASVVSLTCSTAFNFYMSWTYTFKTALNLPRSLVLYLVLFAFNQVYSAMVILWLIEAGLLSTVAKLMTMACVVLWNFVLYRKVIFR